MSIADYLFPRQCIICSKIGSEICNDCLKLFSHTLPTCFVCKKVSNRYLTHPKCYIEPIQCFTGWYLTKELDLNLLRRKTPNIYYLFAEKLIEYLSIENIISNSKILPLEDKKRDIYNLNISIAKHLDKGSTNSREILLVGKCLEDIEIALEQVKGLRIKEPSHIRILTLFQRVNSL